MTNVKTWQERLGPTYRQSTLEMRALAAEQEIAELRAALEAKDKEIEQAAKLSRDWALDYAAMHFDGLPACPGVYAAEYLLGLKDAPMDIAPIMEALEKAKGQK